MQHPILLPTLLLWRLNLSVLLPLPPPPLLPRPG